MLFVFNFLVVIRQILIILIFVRVIFSWVGVQNKYIYDTTEWLLGPMRAIVPPIGGTIDVSPILAYLLIDYVGGYLLALLASGM